MVIKSYTYSDRAEGETQYDVAGYSNEKIVPAHYIPALVPMDKGNPFIEALPLPRTDEEIKMDYQFPNIWISRTIRCFIMQCNLRY